LGILLTAADDEIVICATGELLRCHGCLLISLSDQDGETEQFLKFALQTMPKILQLADWKDFTTIKIFWREDTEQIKNADYMPHNLHGCHDHSYDVSLPKDASTADIPLLRFNDSNNPPYVQARYQNKRIIVAPSQSTYEIQPIG
jgi:hypothetical protein